MMERVRTGSLYADLYLSLPAAMLAGRILSGIAKALILAPGTSFAAWATASFVTALPGISIQLILIPSLIVALTRAGLIPSRYPVRGYGA
jgi:niacin transporter